MRHDVARLELVTREIQQAVMAVRLLPVSTIFGPLERLVRDLARAQGKSVRLSLSGGDTEVDRKILEQLRDPLMHMVRNAVDHGVESPEERLARGKPHTARICLSAAQRGNTIMVDIEDDGAGLDPEHLRRVAVQKGILSQEQASGFDDQAALEVIFRPGFSTSSTITETSGRGVGMDVVRDHVERLNGSVTIHSSPGHGTRLSITVPLTVATTRAILVEQQDQVFAIPSLMVDRTARIRTGDLLRLEGRCAVDVDGVPVPAVELAAILEQTPGSRRDAAASPESAAPRWQPFVVLQHGNIRLAVLADRLLGEQEIVIKSLGWPLRRVRNVSGAAVLDSGRTAVILNPADMFKSGMKLIHSRTVQPPVAENEAHATPSGALASTRRRVLIVDDSLTTRTLERSILEAAGYETRAAVNGEDALATLRSEPIDLVVSDVDMPKLDGFGLTAEIRRDDGLRRIPVVLVTSLEATEHRERGVAVGADAYIVKSRFDQGELLDTIGRLI